MRHDTQPLTTLDTTLESLLGYLNRRFHVVLEGTGPRLLDDPLRRELVQRYLWNHLDVIDDFLRDNPDGLQGPCTTCARDLTGALHGSFYLEERDGDHATLLHQSGVYRVSLPTGMAPSVLPSRPVELRGTIAPLGGLIVPIPPFTTLGRAPAELLSNIHERLRRQGLGTPTDDPQLLARRAAAWRAQRVGEELARTRGSDACQGLGPAFHRGALAGMSPSERHEAVEAHARRAAGEAGIHRAQTEALAIDAREFPLTLEDGLNLLDDELLCSIAHILEGSPLEESLPRKACIARICERIPLDQEQCDTALMWCMDSQFDLLCRLVRDNPLPLEGLGPHPLGQAPHMLPYVFILNEGGALLAWMPPELQALVTKDRLERLGEARRRLGEAASAAAGLASMCGIVSLAEAHERYRTAVTAPLDLGQFEAALTELETSSARDDYALWRHDGTTYLVSVEISDASAPARVVRECYADHVLGSALALDDSDGPAVLCLDVEEEAAFDRRVREREERLERTRLALLRHRDPLPVHSLPAAMLERRPVPALMELRPLQALRAFVDEHVPDGQDDYEFGDLFARSVVVSCVLMRESYSEVMDIIRLYHMEGCEGSDYSDTLGRLVTNAFNALPRWELRGWSLEERTELLTGRRRFFDRRGVERVVGDEEPCPCGSGRAYGSCCGQLRLDRAC